MDPNEQLRTELATRGQVSSFKELDKLVGHFESALKVHGSSIARNSPLEAACCSVTSVLQKSEKPELRNANEDTRVVLAEVLGIWCFLTKVVRLHKHPNFAQFRGHLELLNKGTMRQNSQLRACEEATNKIFELLFALVLLDVGRDVVLDPPDGAQGDNPDILVTLDGHRWGFACKTVYGLSGKALFDNIKRGVEQIKDSEAEIGSVVVNFRNFLNHEAFWPLLNKEDYAKGEPPLFGAYLSADQIAGMVGEQVTMKRDQVVEEIGMEHLLNFFQGTRSIPGFLAFCQSASARATRCGPVPSIVSSLALANFGDCQAFVPVFEKMNLALHERA